eukprot:scaffold554_cov245-Pinguiococcus_pyrenoidosus.AAC.3
MPGRRLNDHAVPERVHDLKRAAKPAEDTWRASSEDLAALQRLRLSPLRLFLKDCSGHERVRRAARYACNDGSLGLGTVLPVAQEGFCQLGRGHDGAHDLASKAQAAAVAAAPHVQQSRFRDGASVRGAAGHGFHHFRQGHQRGERAETLRLHRRRSQAQLAARAGAPHEQRPAGGDRRRVHATARDVDNWRGEQRLYSLRRIRVSLRISVIGCVQAEASACADTPRVQRAGDVDQGSVIGADR